MKYLWTEDSGAGLHYWQLVNAYLFDGMLTVESKGSNQKLLDAVRDLTPEGDDIYYIAFDIVYDNMDIMNKYLELRELAAEYSGQIRVLDLTCFEYIIFSFRYLIEWTGSRRKDKIVMREQILHAFQEHRIEISSITDPKTLQYLMGFKNYSTERVLKSITAELTDQDAWSVKGEKLGKCWYVDCCILEDHRGTHCGTVKGKTGKEKIRCLLSDEETQKIIRGIV